MVRGTLRHVGREEIKGKIEPIDAQGRGWHWTVAWLPDLLTSDVRPYFDENRRPVLRVDKSYNELQVALLVVQETRTGKFTGELEQTYQGLKHYRTTPEGEEDLRALTLANLKQGVVLAASIVEVVLGTVSEGADFVINVVDMSENGVRASNVLAMLPFLSAGIAKHGGNLLLKFGDGKVLEITEDVWRAINRLPDEQAEELFKRLPRAASEDDARRILGEALQLANEAPSAATAG